jgi:peptidoglycan/LPS O-acetylase OafA/YrhL
VCVLLYHLTESQNLPVLRYGYLGVDLFFVLSGFVLTMVYANSFTSLSRYEYLRFLQVRLARIYPLHLATLLLGATLVLTFPKYAMELDDSAQRFSFSAFIACLLLIQNWAHWIPTSWNVPSWSLSAEWLAYLLFPIAIPIVRSFRTAWHAVAAAGAMLALLGMITLFKGGLGPGSGGTVRMACEFGCGAFLCQAMRAGFRIPSRAGYVAATVLMFIALSDPALNLLAVFAFALVVLIAASEEGRSTVFSSRVAVFLGEISYSIYLLHWIVVEVFVRVVPLPGQGGGPPLLLRIIMGVTIVLCLAWVSYRVIELPARRWGRSLGQSPVPVGAIG